MLVQYVLSSYCCLSVCASVCLTQVSVLLKWLNVASQKQRFAMACDYFSDAKDLVEIQIGIHHLQQVQQREVG